jgi:hypothetical protein
MSSARASNRCHISHLGEQQTVKVIELDLPRASSQRLTYGVARNAVILQQSGQLDTNLAALDLIRPLMSGRYEQFGKGRGIQTGMHGP